MSFQGLFYLLFSTIKWLDAWMEAGFLGQYVTFLGGHAPVA
jgi:hypothetical protein